MSKKKLGKRAKVSTVSRETSSLERSFYAGLIHQLMIARRRHNYSQTQLDHQLGVSDGLVAKWESFERMPGSFMLVCWCDALNVDLIVSHRHLQSINANKPPPPPRRIDQ